MNGYPYLNIYAFSNMQLVFRRCRLLSCRCSRRVTFPWRHCVYLDGSVACEEAERASEGVELYSSLVNVRVGKLKAVKSRRFDAKEFRT